MGEKVDNGKEQFEKIENGGYVLSSDKNGKVSYKKVTGVLRYKREHPAYKITIDGGASIIVSENHSICKYDPETDSIIKVLPKDLKEKEDWIPRLRFEDYGQEDYVTVDISDIINDRKMARSVKDFPATIVITENVGRLLGLFCAEGHNPDPNKANLSFTYSNLERDLISFTESSLRKLGSNPKVYEYNNKTSVRASSVCFSYFIEKLGFLIPGDEVPARRKRIPDVIFQSPKSVKEAFLQGLLEGDGHEEKRVSHGSDVHIKSLKTSSRVLADDTLALSQMLGYTARVEYGKNPERLLEGRILPKTDYYRVVIKLNDNKISPWNERIPVRISNNPKKRQYANISELDKYGTPTIKTAIENNIRFGRVLKVEEWDEASEWFYDIEVEDTLTFFSSNGILAWDTGGGEPTLYKKFNELVQWLKYDRGLSVALITNGTQYARFEPKTMAAFSWVRVSINVFDGWVKKISLPIEYASPECIIGCSMVYTVEHEATKDMPLDRFILFENVARVANKLNAQYVRLLPNCLLEQKDLIAQHKSLDLALAKFNDPRFFHQHKIHGAPSQGVCHQAYFRPYLSEEVHIPTGKPGTVYPCDSVVLNDAYTHFAEEYQICHASDILKFLDREIEMRFDPRERCTGCVFTKNVNMLGDWKEGKIDKFNEFPEPLRHEEFV